VVGWDYPLMKVAKDLNPDALRKQKGRDKVCTDKEFMNQFISDTPTARSYIVAEAGKTGISARTVDRYLNRLVESGLMCSGGGLYWRKSS
jgi:hypothetical protein